mgnify:FL=1
MQWIEEMNKMFASNPYTEGRVTIDFCENANAIMVICCGIANIIEVDKYTEYGLMIECMKTVDYLYKNV